MRDIINNKFSGISHKWIKIPIKSKETSIINQKIVESINNNLISKEEAVNLFKMFKDKGFIWIKYNNSSGRKNLVCNCQIITKSNKKIKVQLTPKSILNSELLGNTPKSLKLYNLKKEEIIVDPKDGFDDGLYPPAWMEFTPWAYEEYKQEYFEKLNKNK